MEYAVRFSDSDPLDERDAEIEQSLRREQDARARAEALRQKAEDATQRLDSLLATLSHELRTPLTAILGWVRMLRLGRASADPRGRALQALERSARRQAQLVEDLLDMQRVTAGRLTLRFGEVEVTTIVESVVASVRAEAQARQVALLFRSAADELFVSGDGARLRQMASSLVSNALKFTPDAGRIQIELQQAGPEVLLLVQDDGLGISPSFLPYVFEPFRQEDSGLTRERGGLGIGLALVRALAAAHGGSVSVESAGKGKGACFTLSLPLRRTAQRAAAPKPVAPDISRPPHSGAPLQGARILVVEDDADAQFLITELLEQAGARVQVASNAADGFSLLQDASFDVLVSDISMPGEDGYAFMRRVRKQPAHAALPAVALTANARIEDRDEALAAGFQRHVAKPVEPAELTSALVAVWRVNPSR